MLTEKGVREALYQLLGTAKKLGESTVELSREVDEVHHPISISLQARCLLEEYTEEFIALLWACGNIQQKE